MQAQECLLIGHQSQSDSPTGYGHPWKLYRTPTTKS
jgi:hypothetical protein